MTLSDSPVTVGAVIGAPLLISHLLAVLQQFVTLHSGQHGEDEHASHGKA